MVTGLFPRPNRSLPDKRFFVRRAVPGDEIPIVADTLAIQLLADDGCPHFPAEDSPAASLASAIQELERAFDAFCILVFRRQMPLPVITIQTAGRKRAAAWFWE